jgi:hypothetical protein
MWALGREWMPRTFSKMDLYGIRGGAVSVGLDTFNRGCPDGEIIQAVTDEIATEWDRKQMDTREWYDFRSLPLTRDDILEQALLLVETYINDPPTAFEVIETEYIFREHGWARADVICRLPGGQLAPIDYKVKDSPSTSWLRQAIIGDFKNDWQLMHYCWALMEEFGEECLQYGICLLWYSNTPKIEYVPYTIDPERMDNWLDSAVRIWKQMDDIKEGRERLHEVADHKTKFGPCAFQKACLDFNRDPDLMEDHYIYTGK